MKQPELLPDIKKAILEHQGLSKVGIVEIISHQFAAVTKAEAKAVLDFVAERRGTGKEKKWELREGKEL